jgi:cytochrome c peroxidase
MVELGKMLFFDPRLSKDASVACASCHDPERGWTDGAVLPTGVAGQRGHRHSPTLVNVAYLPHFFWDGRATRLEDVIPQAVENPVEMGISMADLAARLNAINGYRDAFDRTFAGEATPARISSAIAAFVRTIVSGDAPFDRFRRGHLDALSPAARRGHDIFFFQANCGSCHLDLNLTDGQFHNLGIGVEAADADPGRLAVSGDTLFDSNAFKTPTLREIARTAPYMHDGRFQSLDEVVAFYLQGGIMNAHLDAKMNTIPLSDREKADLIAFLKEGLSSEAYPQIAPPPLPQ